jgi:hypothetical protein
MLEHSEVAVIENYLEKLVSLTQERSRIDRQLAGVEVGIRSILALHNDDEVIPYLERLYEIVRPEGFTDVIRKALRSTGEHLTANDVKDMLPNLGFTLDGYSNPLASIHTILKRLQKSGEVVLGIKEGRAAYKWAYTDAEKKMREAIARKPPQAPVPPAAMRKQLGLDKK